MKVKDQVIENLQQEIRERQDIIARLKGDSAPVSTDKSGPKPKAKPAKAKRPATAWTPARRKKFQATMKRINAEKKAAVSKAK